MSDFKKLPINLKPREKLQYFGAHSLTDQELLAIILQTGNSKYSVMQVSQMLFEKYETLENICNLPINELKTNRAIGNVKATMIAAIKEINKRIANKSICYENQIITHPNDIYQLVKYIANETQEHLIVISIDARGQMISIDEVFIGTINEISIHPREIFNKAISHMAYGIFLVHNHPSGNSQPSENDIISTKKIKDIGDFLKIKLLDHIIVSASGYFSLKENCDII